MSASPPVAVLTSAKPAYAFNSNPGRQFTLSTSGNIGAGTIKLQQRVVESDPWVDNPNVTFASGKHLAGILTATAVFNRIVVESADGTTQVSVNI